MPIYINGRSVVHRKSGGSVVTTSINLTGEEKLPIPYVNTAYAKHAIDTCQGFVCNGEPICSQKSYFSCSHGDEAGEYGGVFSGTVNARAEFVTASPNCHLTQKSMCLNRVPIARAGDLMVSNHRNTPPAPLQQEQGFFHGAINVGDKERIAIRYCSYPPQQRPSINEINLASLTWSDLITLPTFFRKMLYNNLLRMGACVKHWPTLLSENLSEVVNEMLISHYAPQDDSQGFDLMPSKQKAYFNQHNNYRFVAVQKPVFGANSKVAYNESHVHALLSLDYPVMLIGDDQSCFDRAVADFVCIAQELLSMLNMTYIKNAHFIFKKLYNKYQFILDDHSQMHGENFRCMMRIDLCVQAERITQCLLDELTRLVELEFETNFSLADIRNSILVTQLIIAMTRFQFTRDNRFKIEVLRLILER